MGTFIVVFLIVTGLFCAIAWGLSYASGLVMGDRFRDVWDKLK